MTATSAHPRRSPLVVAAPGAGVALLIAVLAVILLGCQGPASNATTTPEASDASQATDQEPLHAFPDLEARLPRRIGAIALDTFSLPGGSEGEPGTEASGALFANAVRALGRTPADLQLAFARPTDSATDVVVAAYRLPGVDGAQLLGMLGPEDVDGSIEPATIAGKDVLALLEVEATTYAYAADDVIYVVGGAPELIRAAIQALPQAASAD